jgi:hypothetical protein
MAKPNFLFPMDFKSWIILALTFACGALVTRLNLVQPEQDRAGAQANINALLQKEGSPVAGKQSDQLVYLSDLRYILSEFATTDHHHASNSHSTELRNAAAAQANHHRHDGSDGYAPVNHIHSEYRFNPSHFAKLKHEHDKVPEHSHEYEWWMEQFARTDHKHK